MDKEACDLLGSKHDRQAKSFLLRLCPSLWTCIASTFSAFYLSFPSDLFGWEVKETMDLVYLCFE